MDDLTRLMKEININEIPPKTEKIINETEL